MLILEMKPVMSISWWFIVCAAIMVAGIVLAILAFEDRYNSLGLGAVVVAVIAAIALIVFPADHESGKMKYVIEINDSYVYHELIDRDYKITKAYDIGNIYKVTGDPLPEDLF